MIYYVPKPNKGTDKDNGKERTKAMATDMNKKYELTEEKMVLDNGKVLHRIRAVRDFTLSNGATVHAGDLGGWVEGEDNLSQTGKAWVYGDARVYCEARVYDDARVFGKASVYGSAEVFDSARVFGSAEVYNAAAVYDSARVYGEARVGGSAAVFASALVYGKARIYGYAEICGDARVYEEAVVHCDSVVCGEARVYGTADVGGSARVNGSAKITGDAQVESSLDYAVFKNTWSSGRFFTFTRSNKMWTVGCFHGTGEALIAKAYKDSELSGRCYESIVRVQEAIDKAMEHSSKHIEEEGRQ